MDIHNKLEQLLKERKWTIYRLSQECGISESTLRNNFRNGACPSIPNLELICRAFGLTLAEFFAEDDLVTLTEDNRELYAFWKRLSPSQKAAAMQIIRTMER